MIPLRIQAQTQRRPYFTFTLVAINALVFGWELILMSQNQLGFAFADLAFNPCHVGTQPLFETVLDATRSMFLHGGWAHLTGNMLFLWIFGGKVEEYFGRKWFLIFYFTAGYGAHLAHMVVSPICVPSIGASGAISGVMAAFLLLYPGIKVKTVVVFFRFFFQTFDIPALYMLGYWFIMQLFYGILSLGQTLAFGGVAFWAHIGGFALGLIFTFVFLMFKPAPRVDPFAYLDD